MTGTNAAEAEASAAIPSTTRIFDAPLDALRIGHDFRIDDDPQAIAELAASIAELGIIQPLVVRAAGTGWEVIAGRRRLAAARHVGLVTVPCIQRAYTDDQAVDVTIAENLHRRHLTPVEEGIAYGHLRSQGLNPGEIGRRVGRSRAHVANMLRVLELPGAVRDKIQAGKLRYTTALEGHHGPTGRRQGTKPTPGHQDESVLITHWRRRHDRLIAGLRSVMGSKPVDSDEWRVRLGRLFQLDLQPLDEPPTPVTDKDWRAARRARPVTR